MVVPAVVIAAPAEVVVKNKACSSSSAKSSVCGSSRSSPVLPAGATSDIASYNANKLTLNTSALTKFENGVPKKTKSSWLSTHL